jgi:hypothetical protein
MAAFVVEVIETNSPPHLNFIANQNAIEGQPFNLSVHATDSDLPKNNLSYSLPPDTPPGMT